MQVLPSQGTKLHPLTCVHTSKNHTISNLNLPLQTAKSLAAVGKTERVKKLEEKTAWKSALDKAEGVKVKDDAG